MPEETLFTSETRQSRTEIAEYLRTVADKLEAGERIELRAGGQSIDLDVPETPTFEVKVEREYPRGGGSGEYSVEFELQWDEDDDSGPLTVE